MVCRPWAVVVLFACACGPKLSDVHDSEPVATSAAPDVGDGLPADGSSEASGDPGADDSGEASESGPPPEPSDPDSPRWVRAYDGETHNRDVAICVAVHDDDTILVGGLEVLDPFGGESRSWIARLDGVGELIWLASEERALPQAIAVTPSGRVITAGSVPSPIISGSLMALRSYGPDGEHQWGVEQTGASAYDVATIGEDAIAVGIAMDSTGWITRRDALGEIVFNASVGPGAVALAADAESLLVAGIEDEYITALSSFSALDCDPLAEPLLLDGLNTLALERDALGPVVLTQGGGVSIGRLAGDSYRWSDVLSDDIPGSFEWDVAIDGAGNIVVAGSHGEGARLRKYAPDGALLWTRSYHDGSDLRLNGVAIAPNQDIVAVGSIHFTATDDDLWVSRWQP